MKTKRSIHQTSNQDKYFQTLQGFHSIINDLRLPTISPYSCLQNKQKGMLSKTVKNGKKKIATNDIMQIGASKGIFQCKIGKQATLQVDQTCKRLSFQSLFGNAKNTIKDKSQKQTINRRYQSQKFRRNIGRFRRQTLCKTVLQKLKRTNINKQSLTQTDIQKFQKKVSNMLAIDQKYHIYGFLGQLIIYLIFFYMVSFLFIFDESHSRVEECTWMMVFAFVFLVEIVCKFFIENKDGRRRISLQENMKNVVNEKEIYVNFAIIVLILIKMALNQQEHQKYNCYFLLVLPCKLQTLLALICKIERRLVENINYQKYLQLGKIILFNFAFAHFIAVCLNLMAKIDRQTNWQTLKGIHDRPWTERYVWSYYWAATIMLTIGFGDIIPANHHQAMCLILIEIVSCLAFSYNISCLGNIIANIRSRSEKLDQNRKALAFIASKNNFSTKLIKKIQDYIEEESQLKQKFYLDEQKHFIESLPLGHKKQITRESNTHTLRFLPFFGELMNSSINRLAEKIQKHIFTPQEVILTPSSGKGIMILQSGAISFYCGDMSRKFGGVTVNKICKKVEEKPFVLELSMITNKRCNYWVKALEYSIVLKLQFEQFIKTLSYNKKDYEYYCYLRDQDHYKLGQYQTVPCEQCKTKHTLFDCPRYHFMPLKSMVIRKHLNRSIKSKNQRVPQFFRPSLIQSFSPLKQKQSLPVSISQKQSIRKNQFDENNKNQVFFQLVKNIWPINEGSVGEKGNPFVEIMKVMEQNNKCNNVRDQVWLIGSDQIHSFDLYFPNDNFKDLEFGRKRTIKIEDKVVNRISYIKH